jgi:hypothetical protein
VEGEKSTGGEYGGIADCAAWGGGDTAEEGQGRSWPANEVIDGTVEVKLEYALKVF